MKFGWNTTLEDRDFQFKISTPKEAPIVWTPIWANE